MGGETPIALFSIPCEAELWRRVLKATLELGYAPVVRAATEPLAAAVGRVQADVVFAEWTPEFPTLIRSMREHPGISPHIPVLVVRDEISLDELAAAVEAGATDCLRSRTPPPLLTARIRTAVQGKFLHDGILLRALEGSLRDPLTGLWNHRQFQDLLRTEVSRAMRADRPLGLLMIDLDLFKSINDRYGHPVGDRYLVEATRVIQTAIRNGDVFARYGGEEFTIILPETDRADALRVAERVVDSARRLVVESGAHRFSTTLSVGCAILPEDAQDACRLIQASDMALYQAKRRGRNGVASVRWVKFAYEADRPTNFVGLGGDWNAWAPEESPLRSIEAPRWEGDILLPTGKNRYKYKVVRESKRGGTELRWLPDPSNRIIEDDGFGGVNSIVHVDPYVL